MSQSPKLPSPKTVGLWAGFAALIGVIATVRLRGGRESTFLEFFQVLGFFLGVGLAILAVAIKLWPDDVRRLLEDLSKEPQKPQVEPPKTTSETHPQTGGDIFDILGPWTGVVVFGTVSVVLMIVSGQALEEGKLRSLAMLVSLIPGFCGAASGILYDKESYEAAASWMMRAGMATAAVIALIALLVFADGQMKQMQGGFDRLLK